MLSNAEVDALLKIPMVKSITSTKNKVVVRLNAFTAEEVNGNDEDFKYNAGEAIVVHSADQVRSEHPKSPHSPTHTSFHHPHGSGSYVCYGDYQDEILGLWESKQYAAFISTLCEFFQCWYEDDPPEEYDEDEDEDEGDEPDYNEDEPRQDR